MNLNDPKIVVAIENAVIEQVEASGITGELHRLDGEKIIDVILEQLEGFVLVPKESLKVALFWMNEDIDPWQMGGDSFADLFEHKPILEKVLIEAQEQGHDS